MVHIYEKTFAKVTGTRDEWIEKMNELGNAGWSVVWETYKESNDLTVFEAYFYRKMFVTKQQFEDMGGKQ